MREPRSFPGWCLLCARMAHDNSCGHFPGPMPGSSRGDFCSGDADCIAGPRHEGPHRYPSWNEEEGS